MYINRKYLQNTNTLFILSLFLNIATITQPCSLFNIPEEICILICRYVLKTPVLVLSNHETYTMPNADCFDEQTADCFDEQTSEAYHMHQRKNFEALPINHYQILVNICSPRKFNKDTIICYLLVNKSWYHVFRREIIRYNNECNTLSSYKPFGLNAVTVLRFLSDNNTYNIDTWIKKESKNSSLNFNQKNLLEGLCKGEEGQNENFTTYYPSLWRDEKENITLFQTLITTENEPYPMLYLIYIKSSNRALAVDNSQNQFKAFFNIIEDLCHKNMYDDNDSFVLKHGTLFKEYIVLSFVYMCHFSKYIEQHNITSNTIKLDGASLNRTFLNNKETVHMMCYNIQELSANFALSVLEVLNKPI